MKIVIGLLAVVVALSGCSTSRFLDGKEHDLGEVALVTDVTVLHEHPPGLMQVIVSEDMHIANVLENAAGAILVKKGYQAQPMVATTGFGFSSGKQPLEVFPDFRFASHQAPNMPPYGMYVRAPYVDIPQLAEVHHKAADSRLVLPDRHGNPLPLLVITARGKTGTGGMPHGNMNRGPGNALLSMGSRSSANAETFEKNMLALEVSLLEGGSNKLLWQASRTFTAEADSKHFVGELEEMLQGLPAARKIPK